MMNKVTSLFIGAAVSVAIAGAAQAGTLDDVRQKGFLQCGVSQGLPGFSNPDEQNNWTGMDVDFCRAVAAAVLGDPQKVKFTPLSAKERFTALQSGEIDILSRNTTWTMSRDTSLGLKFAGIMYYDGQGFMVKKSLNVTSAKQLDGASICVQLGSEQIQHRRLAIAPRPMNTDDQPGSLRQFTQYTCNSLCEWSAIQFVVGLVRQRSIIGEIWSGSCSHFDK